MVDVFREVRRVLRSDGTLWLNMGDCYATGAGSGRSMGGDCFGKQNQVIDEGSYPECQPNRMPIEGLKAKDLVGMPWRLAFALQADGWYLRSDIIWHKPNPMPESVTDRPTKSHEYIFLLTKSERYFYDAEAIKEEVTGNAHERGDGMNPKRLLGTPGMMRSNPTFTANELVSSRNKRSVWTIATQPFPEAHFATFPEELITPCILAGTSEKGCCSRCGAPWERLVDVEYENPGNRTTNGPRSIDNLDISAGYAVRLKRKATTTGWAPSCKCNADTAPCTVLDPFAGSGTTGVVALRYHRNFVGIELNPTYCELAEKRIKGDSPLFNDVLASEPEVHCDSPDSRRTPLSSDSFDTALSGSLVNACGSTDAE